MTVLVACEESQQVCMAFKQRAHEEYSCDIQECSGGHPEWHIKWDALALINGNCSFLTCDGELHRVDGKWDMLIAHPPCTHMSKAGACRMCRKAGESDGGRLIKAEKAKAFVMECYNANCDRIAIENPTPLRVVQLPKESQVIQPWQFGEPYSKRTLLWLKGLPNLKETKVMKNFSPWMPSNTGGFSRGKGGARGEAHDPITASKTFPGIAKAMAEQWG